MANFSAGQTGGNEQAAAELLRGQGIQSPSSGLVRYVSSGAQDYGLNEARQYGLPLKQSDLLQEQTDIRNKAIAPAISSLNASKPEIGAAFDTRTGQLSAEKQPLMDRYQNLLADLTGRENKDVTQQSNALATVYGQRGIDLSSGAYQQNLGSQTQGITQSYGVQRKDVGLAQESDLRDLSNQISGLTNQRVAAMRDVDNQIAQLQAGAGNQAATDALTSYRATLDQQFNSRFDDLNKKILEQQANPQVADTTKFANVLGGGYLYNGQGQILNTLRDLRGASGGGGNNNDPLGLNG